MMNSEKHFQVSRRGADVAKWIKAVDCESTMRGFNSRRSPVWPIIVGIMVDARDQVTIISFSSFVLSLSIFLNK